MYVNFNNPLLLIDKPCYLDKPQLSLNKLQLDALIIKSRPWYEQELLRLQHTTDSSGKLKYDISYNSNTDVITEGFTSILSHETIPVHLTITDYERYILAQAMYNNNTIAAALHDSSGNTKDYIDFIVEQQEKVMSIYQKILLNLAIYNSKSLSQTLIGNFNGSKYHYSMSFWIYLFFLFYQSNLYLMMTQGIFF
jgi:hypothetical protein